MAMLVPEFDRYSKSYSEEIESRIAIFGQEHDFFVQNKAEILLRAFKRLGKLSNLKVLDVGCGVGLVHRYIVGSIGELHGADVSGESIEMARSGNPGVRYQTYDGQFLPYDDASFDCAFAICVLHHVPVDHWLAFLTDMRRVVRPDGLLLFIEHNPFNPATQWVVRTCPMDANAVLLPPRKLRMLMKSSGLEDLWVRYVLFTPFAGRIFRRLDLALGRVPLGAQYVIGGRAASTGGGRLARS
jgi:ubiquinone/menaquinone biosynthesis C-methylase UbiE